MLKKRAGNYNSEKLIVNSEKYDLTQRTKAFQNKVRWLTKNKNFVEI